MSASSSSFPVSASLTNHDVFLSFRGKDTRDNFISHLHPALQRKNIEAYIDETLPRGEEISSALLSAIEKSKIYIVVFSQNYASSTWCLNELTKILECKKTYGRDVIPVFYKVDPSTIRKQEKRYKKAFDEHEQHFKHDKVQGWKDALTEAAGLSGLGSKVIRSEHTLVEGIVGDILRKLNRYSTSYDQGIIGIEKNIERIQSLLHLDLPDVRIIGICGMGGIGKTTICDQIYHKLELQFDSSSLVLDVQEKIQRDGIDSIRTKSSSLPYYNERVKRTKVLLILDDVTDSVILKRLIGGSDRNRHVILERQELDMMKEINRLCSRIDLSYTAVKELPSSFANFVNLQSLKLQECIHLESLPNSIVNLKVLSELDCSGCAKLTEIPRHIGRLTSLVKLSLRDSGIVNLPESIAHLSSLKSLYLSKCKKLECIPQIPPFLEQLEALDCPSIRRVMSNSLVRNLSNSKEGVFRFFLIIPKRMRYMPSLFKKKR